MAYSRRCGQCVRDGEGPGGHPGMGNNVKLFAPGPGGATTVHCYWRHYRRARRGRPQRCRLCGSLCEEMEMGLEAEA